MKKVIRKEKRMWDKQWLERMEEAYIDSRMFFHESLLNKKTI